MTAAEKAAIRDAVRAEVGEYEREYGRSPSKRWRLETRRMHEDQYRQRDGNPSARYDRSVDDDELAEEPPEESPKAKGWVQKPKWLINHPDVSLGALSLYDRLVDACDWTGPKKDTTFIGRDELARRMNVHSGTIGRWYKELVALGAIEVTHTGRRNTTKVIR